MASGMTTDSAPRTSRIELIGTAGWAIPRGVLREFPTEGSGLQRYAAVFGAVEINSTFYRSHRPQTFTRWRVSTPAHFRFSVKLPRAVTHDARLQNCETTLSGFVAAIAGLAEKLGAILVQLPPGLAFQPTVAEDFFAALRERFSCSLVCEPRHPSWFAEDADAMLWKFEVARAAADPPRHPNSASPGGWRGISYWRLHGSPRMYYSSYGVDQLTAVAASMNADPARIAWCIFDNTASGAAAANGLGLKAMRQGPAVRG
jgi:uncharacterized protein YecE (DUF72 family)